MKRKIISLLLLVLALSMAACGNSSAESPAEPAESADMSANTPDSAKIGKTLVVYFSTPGLDGADAISRASANLDGDTVIGNTEYIAQLVADAVGADTFRVETELAYPEQIGELLEYAYSETRNNERPELSSQLENLDDYDVIFVGTPVWNYQMPMAMYTFFDEYDFSGKTIAVFTTHRGSGLSGIPEDIAELEPDATVLTDGYTVNGDKAFSVVQSEINEWVGGLFS